MRTEGELNGYVNWYTAELSGLTPTDGEITVGVRVSTAPGGWGTIDDISMVKELEYYGASYQEFFPVWRPVCNRTDTGAKTP